MSYKMLSLVAGACMLGAVGAQAGEPVTLANDDMDNVTAGFLFPTLLEYKVIISKTDITGRLAHAEAVAKGTPALAQTYTYLDSGVLQSISMSAGN